MVKNFITIDRALCMGAGECVASAPEVFTLDDESKAIVLDPDGDDHVARIRAVKGCPNFAIRYRQEQEE